MKKVYAKLLIVTSLFLGFSGNILAQNWMVGDAVNDTVKYLKIHPLSVDSVTSCYDTGSPDAWFTFETCPDPGITYGFVVTELTSSDTVEITPDGPVELGDTVWCDNQPLWVILERKVYFHEADGYITLTFFAIGEVTMPDVEVPCLPADSLWMQTLPVCNAYYWMNFGCTTVSNPLSIDNNSIDDLNIDYPGQRNAYNLTVEFGVACEAIRVYDMQGRIVAETRSANSLDCNELNSGTYVVSIELSSGKVQRQKFVLSK